MASAGAQPPIEAASVPELTGSAAEREALAAEAWLASIVQTLFFALLFMVVAYVLYSGKWVGTLHEMLALFIWAFGVDITSEAVMNAAKGIKLPEA